MEITRNRWGKVSGRDVFLFTLKNTNNVEVSITNYGAIVTSVIMPDKFGILKNIVLNYDTLEEYIHDEFYIGGTIGRVANRIANATFCIDGEKYDLSLNEPTNKCHLHGGISGFNKKVFTVEGFDKNTQSAFLKLSYLSGHLEEGYPGNAIVNVIYQLNENNELLIDYSASSDKATHINLTNHSYFNLSGKTTDVPLHKIYINADKYAETDDNYLPTGKLINVSGTCHDFRNSRLVNGSNGEIRKMNDYFELNTVGLDTCASELFDVGSNRGLKLYTSMPGLLVYTGFGLNGKFSPNQGICLEAQFFPDAPNQTYFESTLVRPEEKYHQQIKWVLGW